LEGIPPEPVDTEEIDRLVHLGPPRY